MRYQPIIIFLFLTIVLLSGGCAVMALRLMADKEPINAVNVESNTSYSIQVQMMYFSLLLCSTA